MQGFWLNNLRLLPCKIKKERHDTLLWAIIPGVKSWRAKLVKVAYKIVLCFLVLSTIALGWACSEDSGWNSSMLGAPVNGQEANWHGKVVNSNGQVVPASQEPAQ